MCACGHVAQTMVAHGIGVAAVYCPKLQWRLPSTLKFYTSSRGHCEFETKITRKHCLWWPAFGGWGHIRGSPASLTLGAILDGGYVEATDAVATYQRPRLFIARLVHNEQHLGCAWRAHGVVHHGRASQRPALCDVAKCTHLAGAGQPSPRRHHPASPVPGPAPGLALALDPSKPTIPCVTSEGLSRQRSANVQAPEGGGGSSGGGRRENGSRCIISAGAGYTPRLCCSHDANIEAALRPGCDRHTFVIGESDGGGGTWITAWRHRWS